MTQDQWSAIYADELSKIANPNADDSTYNKNMNADIATLENALAAQKTQLDAQRDEADRQAYVTQQLAQRDMPTYLAAMGITGGPTETAYSDMLRDYRNGINAANQADIDAYTNLYNTEQGNISSTRSNYANQIAAAETARESQANANANSRAQIQQAEEARQSIIATTPQPTPHPTPHPTSQPTTTVQTSKAGAAGAGGNTGGYVNSKGGVYAPGTVLYTNPPPHMPSPDSGKKTNTYYMDDGFVY